MRTDRYAAFGLAEVDEPFRRAVRDGFKRAGLSHKQLTEAMEWYRDSIRAGMNEGALLGSFTEFTTNKGWPVEQQAAASLVYDAIRDHGAEAVMSPTPTPAEDQETIAKANALLAKDAAAYFADQELQEEMFEALERQAAPQSEPPALGPPLTDVEIEHRIGRQDMQKFERMIRENPGQYWSSPAAQAAYRDAIERANAAPAAPVEAAARAPAATPVATDGAFPPAPASRPEAELET
jgi:hypothetical protein